jgi:hypothetical protein
VFKNRPGTIPELMQVITDNCNLIDVPTLQKSFENMKRRVTLCFKYHCFIALGEEILLQPRSGQGKSGQVRSVQVTHNSPLYENQDFNVLKITNLIFKTDI